MVYLIWLLPPIIIVASLVYVVVKIRYFSRTLFGTSSLVEGLNQQKLENSFKPRSLNSMEAVYLPRIKEDFPGLSIEELKNRAETVLLSSFRALEARDVSLLSPEAGRQIHKKLEREIDKLKQESTTRVFDRIRIHKSVVSDYKKDRGQVFITLQCGLEGYIYSKKADGTIEGDKKYLTQQVYRIFYLYVQDLDLVKNKEAVGLNCPNCGAPVKNLGNKYCDYCGSGIEEVNLRVWRLFDYKLE